MLGGGGGGGGGRLVIFTDYMAHNYITVRNTFLCLEITLYVGLY